MRKKVAFGNTEFDRKLRLKEEATDNNAGPEANRKTLTNRRSTLATLNALI